MGIETQDNLARIVIGTLERIAEDLVSASRATLASSTSDGDPMVLLDPGHPDAAPLHVSIDSPHQITCLPGRSGMTYEVFSKSATEIEEAVTGLAEAIVRGGYTERVDDSGESTKIIARWTEDGRLVSPRNNVLRAPRNDTGGWRTVRYEPY